MRGQRHRSSQRASSVHAAGFSLCLSIARGKVEIDGDYKLEPGDFAIDIEYLFLVNAPSTTPRRTRSTSVSAGFAAGLSCAARP